MGSRLKFEEGTQESDAKDSYRRYREPGHSPMGKAGGQYEVVLSRCDSLIDRTNPPSIDLCAVTTS